MTDGSFTVRAAWRCALLATLAPAACAVGGALDRGGPADDGGTYEDAGTATARDGAGDTEPHVDAGRDARPGADEDPGAETGVEAGHDGAVDAGPDGGFDASGDAGNEGGADSGCTTAQLLVNELRLESAASPLDQFVEIYNPTTCTLSLAGHRLAFRGAHAANDSALWSSPAGTSIAPLAYFVVAGSAFAGQRDGTLAAMVMSRTGGGVALYDASTVVDSVGWGTATNAFVRGSPAPSPSLWQSVARRPNGADSQNNASDFVAASPQTPGHAN